METQSDDYDIYHHNKDEQKPIKGYKLFLVDENNRYLSLVLENPMEFEEGKEYIENGDMSVGKNSFCFGTHDDLDILAFAGYDAHIAVGIITVFPPYILYDDFYRDCCDIGYSQHIRIEKIMNFDEIYEFMSKSPYKSFFLIKIHKLTDDQIKDLIDKHVSNFYFYKDIQNYCKVNNRLDILDYIENKRSSFQRKIKNNN